ncbi:unnamed protein product [Arabidopsis thaliana]|uniref:DC1 domain-containing protein n=1 Tax=Arabidopsis thaliana TaxID=3702 RepID=A0A5S9WQZ2_ARATH|nr:unnamed protein product [Arabidopsis thaliana]
MFISAKNVIILATFNAFYARAHVECLGFPANVNSQLHQHTVLEEENYDAGKCAVCRSGCWGKKYSSKQCKEVFHKECIMSKDAREAAIEEEQIGDINFMYIERFLLMLEEEEEKEEKKEKRRIQDEEITECLGSIY